MSRLSAISGQEEQTQRYAKQVAEMETRIAGMRDRLAQLRRSNNALINQLNAAMEKLAF
jgi:HAMP domain-containing protein